MKKVINSIVLGSALLASSSAYAQGFNVIYDFRSEPFSTVYSPDVFSEKFAGGELRLNAAVGTSLVDGRTLGGFVLSQNWEWKRKDVNFTPYVGLTAQVFVAQNQKAFGGFGVTAGFRF